MPTDSSSSLKDPLYAPPAESPFPLGTSPFRQKGAGFLGDLRHYDAVLPGGARALLASVPDGLAAFFKQSFRAWDWYDVYPGVVLETFAARMRGLTYEQHRLRAGAWIAEDAAKGLYGSLLRFASAESVAIWGPRITSLWCDWGKTDTRASGPKTVEGFRRGVPRDVAQWHIYAMAGFATASVRLAGGNAPQARIGDVSPDGRTHGRDLVKVAMQITWG